MPTYTKTALQPTKTISFRILTDALDQIVVNSVDTLIWQEGSYNRVELKANTFTNVALAT